MAVRPIIEIDRDLCNGCGLCTTACAEGALALDDEHKAYLVKEIYCDGLGACLNVCPTGALTVVEKESATYDAGQTYTHVKQTRGVESARHVHGAPTGHDAPLGCGCPSSMAKEIVKSAPSPAESVQVGGSELSQWPIQLRLVMPSAPYFDDVDLLIAADCTAFSFGAFHPTFLKGKKLVIACPKLDDVSGYVNKLAEIIRSHTIFSLTVVIMSVPCCSGLMRLVEEAVQQSGKSIAIKKIVIDLNGTIL